MTKSAPTSDLTRGTIRRISLRYRGLFLQGYVRGKLRGDPAYRTAFLAIRESALPVLDIGCGIGLFECYVREAGGTMPLRGFDFDERKIAQARRGAAGYEGVEFLVADAASCVLPAGHVVLLDTLHYLPRAAQAALLEKIIVAIPPGGCCVIRTTRRDESWRYRVTRAAEWVIGAIRWMKVSTCHYAAEAEIAEPFRRAGFHYENEALWGRTLFNSYVLVFRRPEGVTRVPSPPPPPALSSRE